MKKILLLTLFFIIFYSMNNNTMAQEQSNIEIAKNTALIIIDIQNFYFPGGTLPLTNPEEAAKNAQKILLRFREKGNLVIHVKHNTNVGSEINEFVAPVESEKIISKDKANSFVGTDLLEYLKNNKIENLVLCGMQTHMCLEAATRAASDYGFKCTVIEDACATRDLSFGDITVSAKDVHYSTLSTLKGTYAKIESTDDFLKANDNK